MKELYRIEKDFLGEKNIEINKYYGIQTLRAKENFDITKTDISLFPSFIKSLAKVKKACAITNYELGDLTDIQKDAIVQACNEIIDGKFHVLLFMFFKPIPFLTFFSLKPTPLSFISRCK